MTDTETEIESGLTYRGYKEEDKPFVLNSWASSYYEGSSANKILKPAEFHAFHKPIRDRILDRLETQIDILCAKDDPWLIVGWAAYQLKPFILHYIYIKNSFQHEGLAREFIKTITNNKNKVITTHLTYNAARIMGKNSEFYKNFKYVPHAV